MSNTFERVDYSRPPLELHELCLDPIGQLSVWWQEAIAAEVPLLDAVNLSTVDDKNWPNSRIVLLKSFDDNGLVFYTNYQSPKAHELAKNPHACMVLFWPTAERQVRIRGSVQKTSREESASYFAKRPRGAQISSALSPQSQIISSREELLVEFEQIDQKHKNMPISCPKDWGGYRLVPSYFEFWQGRQNRLHDRFCYTPDAKISWQISRLAP